VSEKCGPKGPSKYTPEYIEEAAAKLNLFTDNTTLPIWADFCYNNGIHRQLAADFCSKNERFSDAFERMMGKQEGGLIRAGISGKGNSTFIAFIMKNNHGYKDKTEMAHSGMDQFLEGLVQRAAAKKKHNKEKLSGPQK